jgi:hypothetical protein
MARGPTNSNGAQVIPLNIAIIETLNEPIVEIRISVQLDRIQLGALGGHERYDWQAS